MARVILVVLTALNHVGLARFGTRRWVNACPPTK
jgi:hypothetical protein